MHFYINFIDLSQINVTSVMLCHVTTLLQARKFCQLTNSSYIISWENYFETATKKKSKTVYCQNMLVTYIMFDFLKSAL